MCRERFMKCTSAVVCVFPNRCLFLIGIALLAVAASSAAAAAQPQRMLAQSSTGDVTEDGAGASDDRPQGGWNHFVRWIGHFHPPLTAFPIAMVLGAALAESLRLLKGPQWLDGASRWCIIVGSATALVTAPLGWAFAVDHAKSWVLEAHRWLGTAAASGALVLLILSEAGRRRGGGWLTLFRVVLFAAVPLVAATGFFGGALVYGLHAYRWGSQ